MLAGGNSMAEVSTVFTSPGLANHFAVDFPGVGLGESAAQIRLPAGILRSLRVKLTTAAAPSSGSFTLTVRINGADTTLTCSLPGTGTCNANVNVTSNSRLPIRATNNFVGSGNMAYSYTLTFD